MAEGWEELLKSVALPLAQASQWRPHPLPPVSALEKVSKMSAPWETEAQSFQKEGMPTPCPPLPLLLSKLCYLLSAG